MALREFADAGGRRWTVWEVQPHHVAGLGERLAGGAQVRSSHRGGWLAFDCPDLREKRRLMPIPEGWAEMSDEDLVRLCEGAAVAGRSRRLLE